jgi:hypothetical protein
MQVRIAVKVKVDVAAILKSVIWVVALIVLVT